MAAPTHTATVAQRASATATAQAKLAATAVGPIAAISLDSPTDGWAIGDATPQQPQGSNSPMQPVAALYHSDGRRWALKQRVAGYYANTGSSSLTMFSSTSGWVYGGTNSMLRYDGTTWRLEPVSVSGGAQITNVLASDIASPTEGWAIAYISPGSGGSALAFLRFDGSQWTVEQQGIKLPSDLDPQSLQITHIATLPGGDGWAIGNASVTASIATAQAQQNAPNQRGFLIRSAHDVWTVDDVMNLPANASSSQFYDIVMTSATSGWIVGQMTVNMQSIAGGPLLAVQQPLLLRYDGARWSVVQTPQDVRASSDGLTGITASGPDNVWVLAQTSGENIDASGASVSALFLHYDGAAWAEVQGIFPGVTYSSNVQISAMALGPDGTFWSMGSTVKVQSNQGIFTPLITSYRDDMWTVANIATK